MTLRASEFMQLGEKKLAACLVLLLIELFMEGNCREQMHSQNDFVNLAGERPWQIAHCSVVVVSLIYFTHNCSMEAKNNENDPEVVQLQAAVRVHSSAREKGANCKPPTAALHLLQSAAGR